MNEEVDVLAQGRERGRAKVDLPRMDVDDRRSAGCAESGDAPLDERPGSQPQVEGVDVHVRPLRRLPVSVG